MYGADMHSDEHEGGDEMESDDDYTALAKEAFPDENWTPERVGSLKQLIKLCMSGGADDDVEEKAEGESPGKKNTLALVFGVKPKKG